MAETGTPAFERLRAAIESALGESPAKGPELQLWLHRMFEAFRDGTQALDTLFICQHRHCRRAGAADLDHLMKSALVQHGVEVAVVAADCLDCCQLGPAMAYGNRVYCGSIDELVEGAS